MKKNMGLLDKTIRLSLAAVIAILYFTGIISGTIAIVLGIIAILFAITSFINFCPAYFPFGINTISKKT